MRHSYPTTIYAGDLGDLFGEGAVWAKVYLVPSPDDVTTVETALGKRSFRTYSKRQNSYQHRFEGRLFYELKAAVFAAPDRRGSLPFIYFHRWGWTLLRAASLSGKAQQIEGDHP